VCCSVLQCAAVCVCGGTKEAEVREKALAESVICVSVLQGVAGCCSMLQRAAVYRQCCSKLYCVAVRAWREARDKEVAPRD